MCWYRLTTTDVEEREFEKRPSGFSPTLPPSLSPYSCALRDCDDRGSGRRGRTDCPGGCGDGAALLRVELCQKELHRM